MRGRYYQIITVCPTEAEARRIARKLVELRLVACAQVGGPVQSNYWWEGKVEEATEWVCILKAPASNYVRIESEIKRMHSYRAVSYTHL
ncbi:MAG: divalent-cation tolerance protein CutA, partial [Dehalococcoidia bacterium]|nr:divalent-cation tolerance protein CutA [Dehalococcoidia bacterium]